MLSLKNLLAVHVTTKNKSHDVKIETQDLPHLFAISYNPLYAVNNTGTQRH